MSNYQLAKVSFENKAKIEMFSDKQNLREFVTMIRILCEMVMEIIQAIGK